MTIQIKDYDPSVLLDSADVCLEYLKSEIEEGDPRYIRYAISNIIKTRNISEVAKSAKISRTSIYRLLDSNKTIDLDTFLKILKALNLKLTVR